MKLASEGNIILYPLSIILSLSIISSYLYDTSIIHIVTSILAALMLFCLNFFRDPKRIIPKQNNLIIDIGTCITYDFIDSKNIYHGGAISPGFNLRYSSLNDHTSNLPLLEFKEIDTLIGSNTEDSIHSGIYNGIIAEINYHIEKLFIDYNDLNVVITGGSSKFLLNRIKNAIFADQDFIAVGLNYIINYNENR